MAFCLSYAVLPPEYAEISNEYIGKSKVAIIGGSDSAAYAPYSDPSWEKWALPWKNRTPSITRMFEVHNSNRWFEYENTEKYFEFLQSLTIPIVMTEVDQRLPTAIRFPKEDYEAFFWRDYYSSSAAYMIAMAIYEEFEVIALYGIDMSAGHEYEHQRPCMDYWIGQAEGRGIKVIMPDGCPIGQCHERYPPDNY